MNQSFEIEYLSPAADVTCVAELITTISSSTPRRRGSGYLLRNGVVLTASHVVEDAQEIRVRFNPDSPDEWESSVAEISSSGELAVLRLLNVQGDRSRSNLVRLARFPDKAAVVRVHALGYPRFKLKQDDLHKFSGDLSFYRDLHHAVGWCAILSNRRGRSLEVTVEPPNPSDDGQSPWEGMSGSALWVGNCIVGVVTAHHPGDGLNRITACRIDHELNFDSPAGRAVSTMLEQRQQDLVTISSGNSDESILSAYAEQVSDVAPTGGLRDREEELAELAEFCAGDESYGWWQGIPWSGKSALMASFAASPPDGVDIVSFFITGRLSGQADSDAFTDALIDQLAAIRSLPEHSSTSPHARDARRRWLLREVAEAALRGGRRVALIVDGLDEDASARLSKPSIASLLPKHGIPGLVVIVSSRRRPSLPLDVAADHPLRSCPIWELEPSEHAQNIQDQASWELNQLLTGDQVGRDIAGLVSAAGGGLTSQDLVEISDVAPFVVDDVLEGSAGRSFEGRQSRLGAQQARRMYLFAHDTLLATARERLGASLLRIYVSRLHTWAREYEERGWPADTPWFLLTGYVPLCEREGDGDRLARLATDGRLQARLLAETGSDAAALSIIRDAQRVILRADRPSLILLARLALHRLTLTERNNRLPGNLPLVLAKLGDPQRAYEIARMMEGQDRKSLALADMVSFFAERGDRERAEQLAKLIRDSDARAQALGRIIRQDILAGNLTDARQLLFEIADSEVFGPLCADIVDALVCGGRASAVETLIDEAASYELSEESRSVLAVRLLHAGLADSSARFLQSIRQSHVKARCRIALLREALPGVEDTDERGLIERIFNDLEQVSILARKDVVISDLVGVLAGAGRIRLAEELRGRLSDPYWNAVAATEIASAKVREGKYAAAETLAVSIADPYLRSRASNEILSVSFEYDKELSREHRAVIVATNALMYISDPDKRGQAQSELATTLASLGMLDMALGLARSMDSVEWRAEALMILSRLESVSQNAELAEGLLCEASELSGALSDSDWREDILQRLSCFFIELRRPEEALAAIDLIREPVNRSYALAAAASVAVELGEVNVASDFVKRAESTARMASEPNRQVLSDLAGSLSHRGKVEEAVALAERIVRPDERVSAFLDITRRARQTEDHDALQRALMRAIDVCGGIETALERARSYAEVSIAASKSNHEVAAWEALDRARSVFIEGSSDLEDAELTLSLGVAASLAQHADLAWSYFQRARVAVDSISESDARNAEIVRTVLTYIEHGGEVALALELIGDLTDPFSVAQIRTSLIRGVVEDSNGVRPLRDVTSIVEIIGRVQSKERRSQAFADLASRAAMMERTEDVRDLLRHIEDEYWLTFTLMNVVSEAISADSLEMQLVESIEDRHRRFDLLIELSLLAGSRGRIETSRTFAERAESVLMTIVDSERRLEALTQLVSALVASRQFTRLDTAIGLAFVEAGRYIDSSRGSQAACTLAREAARAGLVSSAVGIVESIDSEYWRSRASAEIVGCWASSGRNVAGRLAVESLMAMCLLSDGWRVALPQFGDLDEGILVALAEELLAISG